ncbi:hypothetical protein SEA_SHAM4_56 [Mycobacterium phage Sham4]|uniref:nucleotide kinase n=1 Tax=Mycobacterium phage Mulciber TaxID=1805459 RepID=UPI00078D60E1|nr:nucleotide kinase [Mycobacterium phage Mulciber]AQT28189.1 hypothetical protein SEA_JABITH_57 [Mycobacterium phage Jabith]AXC33516.1 hypothetical protein SEA_JOSELITO_57 [Mycobacterium phage Joselito]AXH50736.1 hypothetical protein SEA_SNAPE_56 [Mycobacterium phage Snape]QBI97887.1 hypothetical protein SEA_ORANGE_56 [Mycobacterium phage Orange]QBI98228.1 hypothetical protein SEA_BOWTIE_57 [Mycobacterium phage Bowtie]QBI98427.1 hypothetical protein SEA_MUNCH_57 [Mycobacterium phage Munch]Q
MTVDMVNHPPHYKAANGLEAIDVLSAFFPDDPLGWQVGKYILRYKSKNGVEDLKKARWYLNRLIEETESAEKPRPRSWNSLDDVPRDVMVRDAGDHLWEYSDVEDSWLWSPAGKVTDGSKYNQAPFVEELDG